MKEENLSKVEVVEKLASLEVAKVTLLEEFVGIDEPIEQLIQSIRTWYTIPDIQERPLVVNLWSLTGCGKTTLISRLSQLLEIEQSFYSIDMANSNDSGSSFYNTLEDIFEHNTGKPFALLLDEFQHSRTKEKGEDRITGRLANIWKMLDSGKLEMHNFNSYISSLRNRIKLLKLCLEHGVQVDGGYVSKKLKTFCAITGERIEHADTIVRRDPRTGIPTRKKNNQNKMKKSMPFVPSYEWDEVLELCQDRFDSEFELEMYLKTLNGKETIKFLEEVLDEAKKPRVLDCSKALIVVAGNLDEAYRMSSDKNPDIPADVWKKMSADISLNHIKDALSERFREEHISRLGNNHIIYPAMGESEFKAYIKLRTDGIANAFSASHGIELEISPSIRKIIYQEGVYPTQGFRPVNTTIDRFVQNNLSDILGSIFIDYPSCTSVKLSFRSSQIVFEFYSSDELLGTQKKKVQLNLQNKRVPKNNDDQALTSVHEAGHVVCCAMLLGEVPEIAVSATSDTSSGGFVIRSGRDTVVQRQQVVKTAAFSLGGYVAEKLIFGDKNVTSGSSSDIFRATLWLRSVISKTGLDGKPMAMNSKNESFFIGALDHNGKVEELIEIYLQEAEEAAREVLEQERTLLLQISKELFKKGVLKQPELKQLIEQHSTVGSVPRKPMFAFKDELQKQLKRIESLQKVA